MRSLVVALLVLAGCSTYRDDLARGQTAFEQNNHERALALFRALEPDTNQLSTQERGHYAYLRGMTDYRIGYRADARHWLLVARAIEGETPGTLPTDWRTRLNEALGELNEQVYKEGFASLTNTRRPQGEEPKAPSPVKKNEDEP
jgi:hypothetical protein